jgi:hypothetical protein
MNREGRGEGHLKGLRGAVRQGRFRGVRRVGCLGRRGSSLGEGGGLIEGFGQLGGQGLAVGAAQPGELGRGEAPQTLLFGAVTLEPQVVQQMPDDGGRQARGRYF